MDVAFIGQPFDDEQNLYDFLHASLADVDIQDLKVVVAWAKRSGLRRVSHHLSSFQARGGTSLIIVGIDEGGATKQGLRLAIDLFDAAHVFHDRSGGTFHPKIYLAKGEKSARLFLGSNNLTAGGVYFNYEAAVEISLDLDTQDDTAVLGSVERYIERLLGATQVCLPLDDAMLARLDAHPNIRIGDEDASRGTKDGPEDIDASPHEDDDEKVASPFGKPQFVKRKDPRPQPRPKGVTTQPKTPQQPPQPASPAAPAGTGTLTPQAQPPPGLMDPKTPLLVAEIPKASDRWNQANFDMDNYEVFFGAKRGTQRQMRFQHVDGSGSLGQVEYRVSVEVASKNYRFELDAANGLTYPTAGRPIGVFLRPRDRQFLYRLVMPTDATHGELVTFLSTEWTGRSDRMRRVRTTVSKAANLKAVQLLIAASPQAFGVQAP